MSTEGAVFFDRDGVLIETQVVRGIPTPHHQLENIQLINGVSELCSRLVQSGVKLFMVTNQPDINRNLVHCDDVNVINQYVKEKCGLTAVAMCPHDDEDHCSCRKPKPGMILDLASRYQIDLKQSVLIGDRWRDVEAGNAAGCDTILIDYQYGEKLKSKPTHIASAMAQVGLILESYFDLTES